MLLFAVYLADPAMRQILHKRFTRSSDTESVYGIYDGEQYKKHTGPGGFLSPDFPDNISLTISTDGVAVLSHQSQRCGQFG